MLSRWTKAGRLASVRRLPVLELLARSFKRQHSQWRVWLALAAIPYGDTRSYTDVGRTIGHPRARARRRTSLRNQSGGAGHPLSSRRPAGGGLADMRGIARKKKLLVRERER